MNSFFDNLNLGEALKESLNEALDYEKGKIDLRTFIKSNIPELSKFKGEEIKKIRLSIDCTQKSFAKLMGVSQSTVEYWESGKSVPSGSSQRMLALINNKKDKFIKEDLKLIG
jgi:putative transcriptional regulator